MPKYSGTKRVSNCYSGKRSQRSVNRDKGQGNGKDEGEESPLAWPIFNCHTWISTDECICECVYLCVSVCICVCLTWVITQIVVVQPCGPRHKGCNWESDKSSPIRYKIQNTSYKIHHIRYKPARLWQAGAAVTCFKYTTLITFPFKLKENLFGNCQGQLGESN